MTKLKKTMRQIILNEKQIKALENLLGEIPMKWANPILQMLVQGLKNTEDPEKTKS